jgi:hypothetical protein
MYGPQTIPPSCTTRTGAVRSRTTHSKGSVADMTERAVGASRLVSKATFKERPGEFAVKVVLKPWARFIPFHKTWVSRCVFEALAFQVSPGIIFHGVVW